MALHQSSVEPISARVARVDAAILRHRSAPCSSTRTDRLNPTRGDGLRFAPPGGSPARASTNLPPRPALGPLLKEPNRSGSDSRWGANWADKLLSGIPSSSFGNWSQAWCPFGRDVWGHRCPRKKRLATVQDKSLSSGGGGNCTRGSLDASASNLVICDECPLALSEGCWEDAALRELVGNWHCSTPSVGPPSWRWCGGG